MDDPSTSCSLTTAVAIRSRPCRQAESRYRIRSNHRMGDAGIVFRLGRTRSDAASSDQRSFATLDKRDQGGDIGTVLCLLGKLRACFVERRAGYVDRAI